MGKTDASNAENWDTSHNTALTSTAMNVMNFNKLLSTALTEYPLQGHWHLTTRHTEIATPDLALGTTWKTEKEETSPDHNLDTADIIAPASVTCTEAAPYHSNRTGTATIEAAQDDPIQHTEDTATGHAMTHHTGHTANPLHTTPHQVNALRIILDQIHNYPTNFHSNYPTNFHSIAHTKRDHTVWDHTPTKETKSPT